jgi:hypothetical protein
VVAVAGALFYSELLLRAEVESFGFGAGVPFVAVHVGPEGGNDRAEGIWGKAAVASKGVLADLDLRKGVRRS